MKKTICLISSTLIMCIFWINEVFAYTDVQVNLSSDKNRVKKGEKIEIILSIENATTAAFTSYIYFDNSYFEYVEGPKMSNLDDNRIIYVWYDENGIGDAKDGELAKFIFKAKKEGITSFNTNGEFYDEDGDVIEANFNDFEITIGEKLKENTVGEVKVVKEDIYDTSNTNLETLAIENMLLYPPFDNNVTSYNLEVPNEITDLNILAIPEIENAKVEVNGGKKLREGNNEIKIIVTAQDGKKQKVFNINAYRRGETEEQKHLNEQEENETILDNIYNIKETEKERNPKNEITYIENNEIDVKNNHENKNYESNIWIYIFIVLIVIILLILWFLKYKNHEK